MKKIFYILLACLSFICISCKSDREEGYIDISKLYKKNMDDAIYYYELYFGKSDDCSIMDDKGRIILKRDGKDKMIEVESLIFLYIDDFRYDLVYEFSTSDLAQIHYDYYFKNYFVGLYKIKNNIIYLEEAGSYVLLNGAPEDDFFEFDNEESNILLDCSSNYGPTVTLPENIEKIVFPGFSDTLIVNVECNENLKHIGSYAFYANQHLESIILNDGLETISFGAFLSCPKLKYVVIPNSVQYMDEMVFDCEAIYCEAESKPFWWFDNFASENTKVYWNNEWKYDENGIPTPIQIDNEIVDSKEPF